MVVYRTPGGGAGEEARRLLPAADRQPQTETPSDTNESAMLGPDRIYRHKSPAAESQARKQTRKQVGRQAGRG